LALLRSLFVDGQITEKRRFRLDRVPSHVRETADGVSVNDILNALVPGIDKVICMMIWAQWNGQRKRRLWENFVQHQGKTMGENAVYKQGDVSAKNIVQQAVEKSKQTEQQ
jgi:hypothetical protein